jgi:DNA-binding NarL/FixJ family response regulator
MLSRAKNPARVVLADDQHLFRTSLRHLLSVPPPVIKDAYGVDIGAGFRVVGEAASGEETIAVVQSAKPDLLLLDRAMPRMSGLEAIRNLGTCPDHMPIVLLAGAIGPTDLLSAIQLGVSGLILKGSTTERLFEAMISVIDGRCWLDESLVTDLMQAVRPLIQTSRKAGGGLAFGLTAREREVLKLVATGCPNKEIAERCAVSEETVKHHVTHIFDKVGVSNRAQLVLVASQCGFDITA